MYVKTGPINLFFHNPLFVNLYSRGYKNSSSSGLIKRSDLIKTIEDHCLVFIDHSDKKNRIMPITVTKGSNYVVAIHDSLNCLLLLRCYVDVSHPYYVYNPTTNRSIKISKATNDGDFQFFRLCYDSIKEKHKVFCGFFEVNYSLILKIKILTLGHGLRDKSCVDDYLWRDIVVPEHFALDYQSVERVCCLNSSRCYCVFGSLYWITGSGLVKQHILCFDTTREIFYKMELPGEVSIPLYNPKHLTEMGGLLCLSHFCKFELKIWTLKKKDNEDGDDWLETLKINMEESMGNVSICDQINYFWPLGILTVPKLKFIIVGIDIYSRYTYFSYDMQSKQLVIMYGPAEGSVHWHVNSIAYC